MRRCESIYAKVLENKLQQNEFCVSNNNQQSLLDDIGDVEYFKLKIRGKLINYARSYYRRLPLNRRESIRKYYTEFKELVNR